MKTLSLYRPLDLGKAMVDIDRFMGSLFGDQSFSGGVLCRQPAVDIEETSDAYILEAEMPGYEEKDVEVNLDGGTLNIESKKSTVTENKDDAHNYIMKERRAETFSRSFKLPENADPENINATFKNGLLCMQIKKRTEAQKRVISIAKD
ncbi:hypothetical protein FACS1894190_04940 [Spirochaetia bacterium]|nr:hypothetical protein FACS1894190_04940 [Spirochaetia bacterium]